MLAFLSQTCSRAPAMKSTKVGLVTSAAAFAAALGAAGAFAGTLARDKAWSNLIEQAKAHGGAETKLDRSTSYVFQRPDGSYLTFTQLLAPKETRSVCLIAKQEDATACVDWDSGKLTLGDRADAATPWRFRSLASLDALEAEKPGMVDSLISAVNRMIGVGTSGPMRVRNGVASWSSSRN
jgi:hypothetical protein